MKILHTEASLGWGGQEIRILREAEGMRRRGHELFFALSKRGELIKHARAAGFCVYEVSFHKPFFLYNLYQLFRIIRKCGIEIVNTHSSLDAWMAGFVAKINGCRVIRTRHISTPIRKGINSLILYNWLADYVVTTCEAIVEMIRRQAHLPIHRCSSVPTGIDLEQCAVTAAEVSDFRAKLGILPHDCLAGTLCILRGWKGVKDLLQAAHLLRDIAQLKWVVVGSGVSEKLFFEECKLLGLEKHVYFTGYIPSPFAAVAAMDIFLLLSTANEGVSQASLQAAWLERPLITTVVGGLSEVCIEGETGFQVSISDPSSVVQAIRRLINDHPLRKQMGSKGKDLVRKQFTWEGTLDRMEEIYFA